MKILVTGGCGFIGQALVRQLRNKGHDTWTLDLRHHPSPKHLRADVRSFQALESCFDENRFDLVYHLAAEAGRWNGEAHYEALWSTNVIGTKHIIRLQERLGFQLVFISSSEVYGDYDGVMEESIMEKVAIRQLNDYAMTKWVGEMQVMNSMAMYNTQSVRVRMFNIYGPNEVYGANRSVVARFVWHALHDLPYTVYLNHHRTSTYVDDVVRTLAAIAANFRSGEVYNIGGTEYHDIKHLSDLILEKAGKDDSKVSYAEGEAFTTRDKRVDVTRAVRDLGHAPRVSLSEGLDYTIQWAKVTYLGAQDMPSV